jgi:hypothetical protein
VHNVEPKENTQAVQDANDADDKAAEQAVSLALKSWRLLQQCATDLNCDYHTDQVVNVIRDAAYAVRSKGITPAAVLHSSWPLGVSMFLGPGEGRPTFVEEVERWADAVERDGLPSATLPRRRVAKAKRCNREAALILAENPHTTIRELKTKLHCSIGLAASLPAWKYTQEQLGKGQQLTAISLTEKVEARASMAGYKTLERLKNEQAAKDLEQAIRAQNADGNSDGSINPYAKRGKSRFRPRRKV